MVAIVLNPKSRITFYLQMRVISETTKRLSKRLESLTRIHSDS